MWEDLEGAFLAVRENDLEALKSLFSRGRYSLLYRKRAPSPPSAPSTL
jgi:hypothetical protein